MKLTKNYGIGEVWSGLLNKIAENEAELKKKKEEEEKKKKLESEEDLERANREQQAINDGHFASIKIVNKLASCETDGCACKSGKPCICKTPCDCTKA